MRCFYGASRPPGDLGEIYDLRDAMKEAMISSRRPAAMRQDRRWRRLDWKAAVALYNPPKAAELVKLKQRMFLLIETLRCEKRHAA